MTHIDSGSAAVIHATDAALELVLELRSSEQRAELLALWIEVTGSSANAYTYSIFFQAIGDAGPDDWSSERGGLAIVVPADSIAKIRGSVLDFSSETGQGG